MSFHKIEIEGNDQPDSSFVVETYDAGEKTSYIALHVDYEHASGQVSNKDLIRIRDGITKYLVEQGEELDIQVISASISNEPEIELKFE